MNYESKPSKSYRSSPGRPKDYKAEIKKEYYRTPGPKPYSSGTSPSKAPTAITAALPLRFIHFKNRSLVNLAQTCQIAAGEEVKIDRSDNQKSKKNFYKILFLKEDNELLCKWLFDTEKERDLVLSKIKKQFSDEIWI